MMVSDEHLVDMSTGPTRGDRPQTAAEARAEVEARRDQQREAREAQMRERFGDRPPGRSIIVASWLCTAAFVLSAIPALVDPADAVAVYFAVSVGLFLAGCALFLVDLVLAAARSRDAVMGIGGLFFLAGSAPRSVQRHLLGSLALQVVVAVLAAALDPFTPLAFGTLVPTIGLAFCGLWSVRHGLFPEQTR